MGDRTFKLSLLALAAVIALSSTTFPGSMLGFFFGVAIAFFVAGPTLLASAALQRVGVPVTEKIIVLVLLALYAALTIVAIWIAWQAWLRKPRNEARLATFRATVLVILPLIGWLSSQALVRAWP